MKVFIYRNLNRKGHIYSIKAMEGPIRGRVIGYAPRIVVENAEFVVSQAGRERVLRNKRKNVHAGCVGDLVGVCDYIPRIHLAMFQPRKMNYVPEGKVRLYSTDEWQKELKAGTPITYNPYKYSTFVNRANEQSVHKAQRVMFSVERVEILNQ